MYKDQLVLTHYAKEEGLSNNQVTVITQCKDGYIWVGTVDGLNRFDGHGFEVFRHTVEDEEGLTGNIITSILESNDGRYLWVGTTEGLFSFDKDLQSFELIGFPLLYIRSLVFDSQKNLMLLANGAIYKRNPSTAEFDLVFESKTNSIREFAIVGGSEYLVGTDTGLGRLDLRTNSIKPIIKDCVVLAIQKVLSGKYIISTEKKGLFCLEGNRFTRMGEGQKVFTSGQIEGMVEAGPGKYWVASKDEGLYFYDSDKGRLQGYYYNIYEPEGLRTNAITALLQDREGNLWIGTFDKGVGFIDRWRKPFMHFKFNYRPDGLPNSNVRCMFQDRDGDIWIGTKEGGCLSKFDRAEGTFTNFCPDENDPLSISSDYVLSINDARPDKLWVATFTGGLNLFDKKTGRFEHFRSEENDPESISQDKVYDVLVDSKGALWVGTGSEGVDMREAGKSGFVHFNTRNRNQSGLLGDRVKDLYETKDSTLWVGTNSGLGKYDRDKYSFVFYQRTNEKYSLSNNRVYSIFEDSKGNFWIGTFAGLNLMDRETNRFFAFTKKDGLASNGVVGIEEDGHGNLWVSTTNGLSKFSPPPNLDIDHLMSSGERGEFVNYDVSDGLQGTEFAFNASCKLENGEMIFGGSNGFNLFHPDSIKDNPLVPQIAFTGLKLFNKQVDVGGQDGILQDHINKTEQIVLTHRQHTLTFSFAALNFSSPEKNQYAYMLEGLEKEWNYVGNQRFVTYTNLSAGNYVFKVKASNNDGVWNEEGRSIKIKMQPPWWTTLWFRMFCALLSIGVVISIFRYRTGRLKRTQKMLEKMVDQRTVELREANTEIQDQNKELNQLNEELQSQQEELSLHNEELMSTLDQLKMAQAQLVQSEKMASLGLLTAGIAHEINNPVNFIKSGISGLQVVIEEFEKVAKLYEEVTPENAVEKVKEIDELKKVLKFDMMMGKAVKITRHINTGVERTADIVKGLRSFSRSDTKMTYSYSLAEGIDNNLLLINHLTKDRIQVFKNINVFHEIECSPSQINQVLMNLLVNAVQSIEGEGNIYISATEEGENVVIKIRDTGNGIAPADIKHIFDPFFTTKEVGKGTGMGLSITLGIIEEHLGKIKVESVVGEGTTMIITLPIRNIG
ncbi:two-component regulator propeller domain-containing protein [Flammeovirgaceae bacterium SG7u.111]|nr:two-component regulator propeller domain-containing protein [Flammeovirgaceae bacterium SG7u.132]WPO34816.1 two-component regulator propeller domain-containing protein [Flammeovirgaceae bacterium SG7u.111]